MMGSDFSGLANLQILLKFIMQKVRWFKSSPIGKHSLQGLSLKELFNSNPSSLKSTLYFHILYMFTLNSYG